MRWSEILGKITWTQSLPFILMHLACVSVFFVPFSPWMLALCVASYYFRMLALTSGYHRYFSHRTYKINRFSQFVLAFWGGTCVQKGALWWAAHHRIHHRHSDTDKDIHSPFRKGFAWSHLAWILAPDYNETEWEQIPDLAKFPELRFLNTYHLLPGVLYGIAMLLAFGWSGFVWGFVVSTVVLWHGTFTINSLSHVYGSRRYTTTDTSRNNLWLALLTCGEGWHNNHHCYQSSTRQGFFWWEVDLSYYWIKSLSWIGVTRDVREPPLALLEAKRISRGAVDQMPTYAALGSCSMRSSSSELGASGSVADVVSVAPENKSASG